MKYKCAQWMFTIDIIAVNVRRDFGIIENSYRNTSEKCTKGT